MLLPGVADLVPFVWLLSAKSRVKHAAAIAGVIGVARLALPQLMLGFIAARYAGGNPSCFVDPFMLVLLVLLMLGMFAVSILLCVSLIRRAGPSQLQLAVVIISAVVLFVAAMLVVYFRLGYSDFYVCLTNSFPSRCIGDR